MPSPPNPATEAALQLPPNQRYPLPDGPVDFGATSVQNLYRAFEGKGAYATEGPRRNLRLLATIQAPNYLIVAVKSEFGVTDLSQLKAKRWPLRVLVGNEGQEVLNYYGLTRQAIESAGGHVGSSTNVAERANFDAVVAGGSLGNAPEFNVWYEVSQKYNLTSTSIRICCSGVISTSRTTSTPCGKRSRCRCIPARRGITANGDT